MTKVVPPLLSNWEIFVVGVTVVVVWMFIWLGSYSEWNHNVPKSYDPDTCAPGGQTKNMRGCRSCKEGYVNGGYACFANLEDLPPVQTGAFFGGPFYFGLIVVTQLLGCAAEIFLIEKVRRRGLMPRKELVVLLIALFIEITRMLMVDVFVLKDYFGGFEGNHAYRIYRKPTFCDAAVNASSWLAADGSQYCNPSVSNELGPELYYIATSRGAYSGDTAACSIFPVTSPLLDFSTISDTFPFQFWPGGGHPRFYRLGWVIGGEFAFYYFFATFVNELADNMFVIPTTTSFGWQCKIFSIALELFQLGALCPAAIFTHSACLHYTDPLGVPLGLIRDIIVWFGYCIAVIPFFAIPLALIGLAILGSLGCLTGVCYQLIATPLARLRGESSRQTMDNWQGRTVARLRGFLEMYSRSVQNLASLVLTLAFVPLLLSGMLLGSLVIVGQASKPGGSQIITAVILVSDVLFKIVATLIAEITEYALHVRVRQRVAAAAAAAGDRGQNDAE
eukprot:TRINITY_DN5130_c0_g1_i4.p1 TRINITY_DN5130_c0_g1~~TRINITY_DN5130_c0_g1_i4.p1  ORF type:complete len:505 (-),score=56.13 TRINITY_DN5130_c0_g1_i4:297-1811(-)